MSKRSTSDEAAVRYLLGDMTEEEKTVLERGLFENDEAFEQVAAVEDELIDDYLSGDLSARERARFERAYLDSPERRERVEFGRVLRKRLAEGPAAASVASFPRRPAQPARFFLAAAAVLLVAIGAYFVVDSLRARKELRRLEGEKAALSSREQGLARQATEARGQEARLEQELARARSEKERLTQELASLQARETRSVSFTLMAGLLRDSGTLQTLKIPPGVATVRLTLPLSGNTYPSYRTTIQTPEGKEVWKGSVAPSESVAKSLILAVPANALPSGDYILSVTGLTASGRPEPAADYSFRVKRR